MGRTLNITIKSASNLPDTDEAPDNATDAFVLTCFDANPKHELGRSPVAPDTTSPVWDHTFSLDVTDPIAAIVSETGVEPQSLSFLIYDRDLPADEGGDGDEGEDAVATVQAVGMASLPFADLVKNGKFEGELPLSAGRIGDEGEATISVSVEMKRVRIGSMLKDDAALKIAGGVVGVAALGALGAYLYKRYEKKKEKVAAVEGEGGEEGAEGEENVGTTRTGIAYGANVDDDDDDDDDKDNFKAWWEMDDEEDDDDDDNRWGEVDNE